MCEKAGLAGRISTEHVAGEKGGIRGIERGQHREGQRHAGGAV